MPRDFTIGLHRIPLDRGGYDRHRRYYGTGAHVYRYFDINPAYLCRGIDDTLRAIDRADARTQVLELHPGAKVRR